MSISAPVVVIQHRNVSTASYWLTHRYHVRAEGQVACHTERQRMGAENGVRGHTDDRDRARTPTTPC